MTALLTPAARRALFAVAFAGAVAFVSAVTRGDAARGWGIYLVNFLFWSGLAQAAVAFLAILHLSRARWAEPLRKIAEALSTFLAPSFALALVLPLGHASFYPWLSSAGAREQRWLAAPLLTARLLLGLAVLHGLLLVFVRRPRWRDRLAPVVVIAYAVGLTLLSFDWVMSLDARWLSTLVGGYFSVGALYAGLAAIAVLAILVRCKHGDDAIPARVLHDQGKLLLGFCMLWAYLLYSQYIVIWYGDLPEETGFVLRRTTNPWSALAGGVVLFCFVVPFCLLLSRRLKQANAGLGAVAGLALVGLFAERFLLVMPSLTGGRAAFGLVEIFVSAAFCAAFLLCILPTLERDNGGVMQNRAKSLAVAAAAVFFLTPGEPAHAQTVTWEAPPEAKNIKRPAPADASSAERGQKLYSLNCLPCHGQTGKGEGPMSKALNVHAGNLTDRARMGKQSDGEIFWKTAKGKTPMPVFEQKLAEKELWDVVAYVRSLAK